MRVNAGSGPQQQVPVAEAERSILILAPLGNDARLAARFLQDSGMAATACRNAEEVCALAKTGCGAWLVAEEALDADTVTKFNEYLQTQPSWSDLNIVLITSGGDELSNDRRRRLAAFGERGTVTLLERPFRPSTLVSTLQGALRARERQYQVRDFLASSQASRAHLEFVLEAGGLGVWKLDLRSHILSCSDLFRESFGVPPQVPFRYETLEALIHADDRPAWLAAMKETLASGKDLVLEFRVYTPSGELRWLQMKGRVARDPEGQPLHLSGISQNVTARREAEEALRGADRRKDEFLAMLAHELRNPLASVRNAVTLLKEETSDETRAWAADVIARQNGQLARLVDDLLDVSRITRGKIELRKELLDAASCLESACEAVTPLVAARWHNLYKDFPQGELWLEADATRLEQIAVNLLANAAKYTEPHGKLWLEARREGAEVVIRVRDNGIGIAPENIGAMFGLFAQGERTAARTEGGLGIGLTVVRGLCELHGGSVAAHSDGPGKGTVFTVRLPAAPAPEARRKPLDGMDRGKQGNGSRVLIVEDNVDTATGLGRLLTRRGFNVRMVHNGTDALDLAQQFDPQIVLLDIGLPGMDGFEVVRHLRQTPHSAKALVIALSGYGQAEDHARSRAAGFDHHLVKPFDLRELQNLLATAPTSADAP